MGPMQGLTAQNVKDYIRFIANRRLDQLGLERIYDIDKNPLTWLDTMLNAVEHMNFFEGRATEYSKASTKERGQKLLAKYLEIQEIFQKN